MDRPSVTAVIPAYNEEETIEGVVKPLCSSLLIDEIIVISDGSTDKTIEIAEAAGATVYQLSKNVGKGKVMLYGVSRTKSDIVVFLDADLRGLTTDHVEQLVFPVVSGAKVMNVGIRDRGRFWTRVSRHLPLISGERAIYRKVFEQIPPEYIRGYMVESALNYYCRSHGLDYGSVILPNLTIRRKYEKVAWPVAVVQYVKMFAQVGQAMVVVRLARIFGRF